VHTHYFLVDEGADGHDVEDIGEGFPQFDVVLALACISHKVH